MSRPSRSFGSNHVDLGGIISPASAIRIRSPTVGEEGKGDGRIPLIYQPFELAGAANATDKIEPLVGPRIRDLEQRGEHLLLEKADIERDAGIWQRPASPARRSVCQRPSIYIETSPFFTGTRPAVARFNQRFELSQQPYPDSILPGL